MGALCVNLRPLSVNLRPNFVNLRPSLVITLLPDHSSHFRPTDFAFKPLRLCHTKEAVSRTGGSPVRYKLPLRGSKGAVSKDTFASKYAAIIAEGQYGIIS